MVRKKAAVKKKPVLARRPDARASWTLMLLVVTMVVGVGYFVVKNSRAASCTISPLLVNSCRPWFGAAVSGDPRAASDQISQFDYLEKLMGRSLDIFHDYHPVGSLPLSSDEIHFADRANTYIYVNWKPAATWADADGSDASVNADIDRAAASIKSVAPHKLFLTVWHEPENDVSGGTTCAIKPGTAGTPAQYKAMWQNVENRFKADGVTNVVWVMNYMGYAKWDCLIPQLWPGNNLVDWVTYDTYGTNATPNWSDSVGRLYNLLRADSTSTTDFDSKPWGVAEFGTCTMTNEQQTYQYFADAKAAVDADTYPNLKMYMIYDDTGNDAGPGCLTDSTINGTYDAAKQVAFNAFANDPIFTSGSEPNPPATSTPKPSVAPSVAPSVPVTPKPSVPPSPSPTPELPKVSIVSPTTGVQVGGTVTIAVNASAPTGVTQVDISWDGKHVIRDATAENAYGWGSRWDSHAASNGTHTILVTAYDATGRSSASVAVNVENGAASNLPSKPGDGKAAVVLAHMIVLGWKASTGKAAVAGYHLFRGGKLLGTTKGLSYTDQTVLPSSSYTYGIEAYDAAGDVSPWAIVEVSTPAVSASSAASSGGTASMTVTPAGGSPVRLPEGTVATVAGVVAFSPSADTTGSGSARVISVDGGTASTNGQLDTTYLTNGLHTITASVTTSGGTLQTSSQNVNVSNRLSPLESTRNELFAAFHGNVPQINMAMGALLVVGILAIAGFMTWLWGAVGQPSRRPTKARATMR